MSRKSGKRQISSGPAKPPRAPFTMRLRPDRGPKLAGTNRSLRRTAPRSNFTAKRLTVPPGFLSLGVKADAVKQAGESGPVPGYDCDDILEGNLHGLFRTEPTRKPPKLPTRTITTASTYFADVTAGKKNKVQDRAKSVFRKIQERFREIQEEWSKVSPIQATTSGNINDDFGSKLFKQIRSVELKTSEDYKGEVAGLVGKINEIWSNKRKFAGMSGNRKRQLSDDDKENYPVTKFPYLPKSKWVFQTPPNRKLNFNNVKVNEQTIKPAVVRTAAQSTVVYEVDTRFNVDLTGFKNQQDVEIDKRFMREVAKLSNAPRDPFQMPDEHFNSFMEEDAAEFNQTDPFELEHHFLGLTCRPKKVVNTVSRTQNSKRKRDIFVPEPGCSSSDGSTFDSDFACINMTTAEESFTMKFTPTGCRTANTAGHMFDFTGNKKDTFKFHFEN